MVCAAVSMALIVPLIRSARCSPLLPGWSDCAGGGLAPLLGSFSAPAVATTSSAAAARPVTINELHLIPFITILLPFCINLTLCRPPFNQLPDRSSHRRNSYKQCAGIQHRPIRLPSISRILIPSAAGSQREEEGLV